jgi:septation ring formation regulator EzrA
MTQPSIEQITARQDELEKSIGTLEANIASHFEYMTGQMLNSFKPVEARLSTLEKDVATIRENIADHRIIMQSLNSLLHEQSKRLDRIEETQHEQSDLLRLVLAELRGQKRE